MVVISGRLFASRECLGYSIAASPALGNKGQTVAISY